MKYVIIGGGIAGLSAGICLKGIGANVVICERTVGMPHSGHAFLMQDDALNILAPFAKKLSLEFPGYRIGKYTLKRPDGREVKRVQLHQWKCVRRNEFLGFLQSLIPSDMIKDGRKFCGFIKDEGDIIGAQFENGEIEYGDIFIGSDGAHSKVREDILGKINYTPVEVTEIVGSAVHPEIYQKHIHSFTKYQSAEQGLSFGMIPTAQNEFVWFVQYDSRMFHCEHKTPEETRKFCTDLLADFPDEVHEIMASSDFEKTYLWKTHDFDILGTFHHENTVLIGDAAHLALPFTSAGASNAINDASTLATLLNAHGEHPAAFNAYYRFRQEHVKEHLELGRKLKYNFLNPLKIHDDEIRVPLIPVEVDNTAFNRSKQLQIQYFTDPVCSTCWSIQPILRKLKLEYDELINIEYRMGGLLKTWEDLSRRQGPIQSPEDAARHWDIVRALNEMPMDGSIWLNDPPYSSYPPSIAFKAAQMQSEEKAILFLRRIKEMIFMEKKNIIKWRYLEDAAFELGLDAARLKRDFDGKAQERFSEDLELAGVLGVTAFPTLFFENKNGQRLSMKGYQDYRQFEKIILELLPHAKKKEYDKSPLGLFKYFYTLTTKEFSFLSDIGMEETEAILNRLCEEGKISQFKSSSGVIWINQSIVMSNLRYV
jgi:2-polyprenyl-6-methoxyphenol hydroxylase-like FAD-dependent oxidoreductase/predicted DsbA family dithiol-disulfide isomerase